MKTNRISIARNLCIAAILAATAPLVAPLVAIPSPARAADPKEMSKEIIAVQIRKQGFACTQPAKCHARRRRNQVRRRRVAAQMR